MASFKEVPNQKLSGLQTWAGQPSSQGQARAKLKGPAHTTPSCSAPGRAIWWPAARDQTGDQPQPAPCRRDHSQRKETYLPNLYSSGLYPMCLMSLSTPSAAGPCQWGQVAGQSDLYLKHQQDVNTNDLMFEEPLPRVPPPDSYRSIHGRRCQSRSKWVQTKDTGKGYL